MRSYSYAIYTPNGRLVGRRIRVNTGYLASHDYTFSSLENDHTTSATYYSNFTVTETSSGREAAYQKEVFAHEKLKGHNFRYLINIQLNSGEVFLCFFLLAFVLPLARRSRFVNPDLARAPPRVIFYVFLCLTYS